MRKSACWIGCLVALSLVVNSALVAGQQPTSAPDSSPVGAPLPAVVVTAEQRDRALDHVGFYQRAQHSVGHYLTVEQINRMSDFRFTDLLRGIPGLRVGIDKYGEDVVASPRAGGSVLNPTYGCVQYFVDGIP